MVSALRFGRRLKVPSTVEIKHQLLRLWLKDQVAKEAAEAAGNNTAGKDSGPPTGPRDREASQAHAQ